VILECIVTTRNDDRNVNISPMGATIELPLEHFILRPFCTSRTYLNLRRHGEGVLHVTDDVELLARAAVDRLETVPDWRESQIVDGVILAEACRWYAFQVVQLDDAAERTRIECRVVGSERQRDFLGFNRAKHAVLEAAILATRMHLLPADTIRQEMQRLAVPVEKTAGPQERRAFEFLQQYLQQHLSAQQQ
jgi:uncharacterized protein